MSYLGQKSFWTGTLERAVKTFLQALIAALTLGSVAGAVGVDLRSLDWKSALWLAIGATVLSVLSSIASGPIGTTNSPSLVKVETT